MAKDLLENATHLNDFIGSLERRTDTPADNDVAGFQVGRIWHRTDTNTIVIKTTSTVVRSMQLTTTSTSTS